jgi:PKD repeat protein
MRLTIIFSILVILVGCKPPREAVRPELSGTPLIAATLPTNSIIGGLDFEVKFQGDRSSQPMPAKASVLQQSLNPTGEPVGGGPGFSRIYRPSEAKFVANDVAMLIDALRKAKFGDVIFVPGHLSLDLSSRQLSIPAGVTLASDRGNNDSQGALLFSNTHYHQDSVDSYRDYLFVTAGPGVKISGLRLRGPLAEIDELPDRVACGIKGMHGNLEVSNCELSHWLKWAIDLAIAQGDHVHHNYIHHTRRAGFGYGVWVRGAAGDRAPVTRDISVIEANLLENCRHEIASGGQASSSFIARHNIIARHDMSNHMIDRHHQGAYTEVSNNLIAPSNHFIFHGMSVAPADALVFRGNWCDEKDIKRVFPNHAQKGWNIRMSQNELGGSWRVDQPQVMLQADATVGEAPLKVSFQASGSDPATYPIDAFVWDFYDGRRMMVSSSRSATVTYRNPGIYTVRVRARNAYGLMSEPVSINVIVRKPGMAVAPVARTLIALWDFNDTRHWALDAQGNIELRYKPPLPLFVKGVDGMALQRVSPPAELVQNPFVPNALARALQPGSGDFSFSMVFRLDKLPESGKHVGLLGYGAGSETEAGYNLSLRQSEPNELCYFMSNGRGKRDRIVISKGLKAGIWYHIIVSVSRDKGLTAWLDGKVVTENARLSVGRDDVYHDSHNFGIPGRFVLYPQASIDQAAFWSSTLSGTDAAWLWNDSKGRSKEEMLP